MRFKKKEILFWEGQIIISTCLIVSIILMVVDSKCTSVLLIPTIVLLATFMLHLIMKNEYIVMNEVGIICQKGKQLLWIYKWTEIAELKISNRFRNPSVEIVLKSDCINDKGTIETVAYFQLGLSAKKALKNYCKCPVVK